MCDKMSLQTGTDPENDGDRPCGRENIGDSPLENCGLSPNGTLFAIKVGERKLKI